MKKEEARTILGVAESDNETVIKKAYRKLALKNHPDKNNGSEESKKKFQQISEAYKCLTDPKYEDDAEGFGDINEEEMFEMFNEMFSAMFGGSMLDAMFGMGAEDDDGDFDFFPFPEGDLLDLDDLSEEEAMKAEKFIQNGDQSGFMRYMNQLQRKKDAETRKTRAGTDGLGKKSTSTSKSNMNIGPKSRAKPGKVRNKFSSDEEMMEEMMMSMMMGGNMMGANEDDMAAMASMMFGEDLDGRKTEKPIDSDDEEILADLMAGMSGMGLGRTKGVNDDGLEDAMMAAFMQDMLQGGAPLDDYNEEMEFAAGDRRRRKVKVKSRVGRAPNNSVFNAKRTREEGLDY